MKKIVSSLKLELAQYREVEAFASFGSDLDSITRNMINHGSKLVELLKQTQYTPQNIFEQLIISYAGIKGFLDSLTSDQIDLFKNYISNIFRLNNSSFSNIHILNDLFICFINKLLMNSNYHSWETYTSQSTPINSLSFV